jgi:precorrin-8X/cobalt-precorrin-8 methylmutase
MAPLDYVRDPDAIYRQSFAEIGAIPALAGMADDMRAVATRIVHACGMPEVASDLVFTPRAVAAGRAALASGKPIFCDVEMAKSGIISRSLPSNVEVICEVGAPAIAALAQRLGSTRSAAQIDHWGARLEGAILVIGNAPTALFRLLETVDAGGVKPSLIVAFPVGFVGAAESKAELVANPRSLDFITLPGRRGGSAMAAAAMNAVTAGLAP